MIKRLLRVPARMLLIALAAFCVAVVVSALIGAGPKQPAETSGNEVSASASEVVKYDVRITGESHKMRGAGINTP